MFGSLEEAKSYLYIIYNIRSKNINDLLNTKIIKNVEENTNIEERILDKIVTSIKNSFEVNKLELISKMNSLNKEISKCNSKLLINKINKMYKNDFNNEKELKVYIKIIKNYIY